LTAIADSRQLMMIHMRSRDCTDEHASPKADLASTPLQLRKAQSAHAKVNIVDRVNMADRKSTEPLFRSKPGESARSAIESLMVGG
jgi:hypothetical protein